MKIGVGLWPYRKGAGGTIEPLVLGPMDVVIPGRDVFTNFSQPFQMASPDAIVYFGCHYSGNPVIEIRHGGELLEIVQQNRDPVRGLLSLIAVGGGLTVEGADLTITATGGMLDGGALRINEMTGIDPALTGWKAGASGNNPPIAFTQTGTSGGVVKGSFVNGGVDRTHSSRVIGAETKFSGFTVAGDRISYDVSANSGNWTLGEGWSVVGNTLVHTGPVDSICVLTAPVQTGSQARRAYVDNRPNGRSWIGETNSTTSGIGIGRGLEGYVCTGASGSLDTFAIWASGDVVISEIDWFNNAQSVTWVFFSTPAVDGGEILPVQAYRPYWSVSMAEVLGQDYE